MSTKEQQAKHYAKWYAKNRERICAEKREWYRTHPKEVRRMLDIAAIKYAARKAAA